MARAEGPCYTWAVGLFHKLLLIRTKPLNPLEEALLAFLKGSLEPPVFEARLKDSKVYLLIKGQPAPDELRPMVIEGAGGNPVLCVFTHLDRAAPLRAKAPEYGNALEVEFPAVLKIVPLGVGMAFNPGNLFSTELTHEGVEALRPPSL